MQFGLECICVQSRLMTIAYLQIWFMQVYNKNYNLITYV